MKLLKIEGKPVVDAKRKIILRITERDVRKSKSAAPDCCAAALAIMRQMKAKRARVHVSRVYIEQGSRWVRFATPASLRTEIVSFDRGHRFQEGNYTLAPLQPALRSGRKRASGRKKNASSVRSIRARDGRVKKHIPTGVRHTLQSGMYS